MKNLKASSFVMLISSIALTMLIVIVSCNSKKLAVSSDNGGIKLPDGFSAVVVSDSVGWARHITVNSNGDIYVALQQLKNGHGIVALRDNTGDGKADIVQYFGKLSGTGIGIHKGYLYFGCDTAILRYKLNEGSLLPDTTPEIIVRGFHLEFQHASKPFTFDNEGNIYVTVGAPANACQVPDRQAHVKGVDPCPLLENYGGIWKFKDDVPDQIKGKDGSRYASGIRNAVALDWNFKTSTLYAVQHGRDQLHEFWPELYTEDDGVNLPAEEFFLIKEGMNFGWPYCYYDQDKKKKILAPEYGGNADSAGRCKGMQDPIVAFPGHIAPNCLKFYTGTMFPEKYRNGAFIAFHGSWNRAPQEQLGFFVAFVPFKDSYPSGPYEIFADGFKGPDKVMNPNDAWHRPMGLAVGPDGSLYVTDSRKVKIWRIIWTK
jgi:glucose/arabinose dehydrogenase